MTISGNPGSDAGILRRALRGDTKRVIATLQRTPWVRSYVSEADFFGKQAKEKIAEMSDFQRFF